MSPTIRVDEEVFGALQAKAQAFVDSPNDVLRRLLGLNGRKGATVDGRHSTRSRLPAGESTPTGAFREPILGVLAELGGEGRTGDVLQRVEAKMANRLTEEDRGWLPDGGDFRWRKKAGWEAYNMQREGLLRKGDPRGFWRLTDKGWVEYRRGS